MIVEIRKYRIVKGQRERFLDFFVKEAVPLQRSLGIGVTGPFVDTEDPDVFVWLRAFPSPAERDRLKQDLYEGSKWKNELEGIAMPMLDHYDVVVAEVPHGFVNELGDDRHE